MRKAVLVLAGAVIAATTIFLAGGMIAIVALGQFKPDINPLKLPEYFWFYRGNSLVMGWLFKGMAGTVAAICLAALIVLNQPRKLHGAARWARSPEVKAAGLLDTKGIILGRYGSRYLRFGGSEHVLLEAPTRSGKGVGVVIPNLLEWPDSVVVLDVKQENWEKTAAYRQSQGQKVLLFDPLDVEGRTARFNPLTYINRTDEVEVINELQKMAAMLFPPPTTGESFWADSARTAFIGVASYVAATPERPFTFGEIYRQITTGDPQKRFPAIVRKRADSGNPLSGPCVSALTDWTASSDNTFTGIRQSVTAKLNLWLNPYVDAATSESDFDFRDFRNSRISLYLGVSPDNIERVSDLYNLLFQQLIDLNVRELPTQRRNNVQLLLLLDEFARLGRASVIASGFSYVAGYGIRLVPVIQSRSQLRDVYGRDVTDEIVANCGAEIIFTPKELQVAKEVSERLGYETVKSRSYSQKELERGFNRSVSTSDQRRALMLPQELLLMPARDLIVLRSGIAPVKGRRLRYFKDKQLSARTMHIPPTVKPRPVDRKALAGLLEDIVNEEIIAAELTDDEALSETAPKDIKLNGKVVEALRSDLESGVEMLTDLFSTSPAQFVDP
jgi:type IV secretion system protein VirD4